VEGLVWAGFDALSLANNHSGDYGLEALVDTFDLLEQAGIAVVGAGRTITEAQQMRVLDVNGLRVGILAANQIPPTSFSAADDRPGHLFPDVDTLAELVAEGRHHADVVLVSCHWGIEYASYPSAAQHRLGRALAEAGAALVIGHHPHVIQGLEIGAHSLIAYSLGNFVFDMGVPGTADGLALRCLLDVSGVKTAELLPYRIFQSQPQLLSGDEGEALVEKALRLTRERNGLPRPLPTPTPESTVAP
jgi:gamma-polyglutamate biosynthesis protein CapA